jgi:hypothetical protein
MAEQPAPCGIAGHTIVNGTEVTAKTFPIRVDKLDADGKQVADADGVIVKVDIPLRQPVLDVWHSTRMLSDV